MKKYSINTSKTARYYTLGNLTDKTSEVIFAFHGYAQLAKDFIKNFESIQSEKRFIIAPEGLSKFYFKNFTGKIGASWMTKEDRENEIEDYLNFFDNVYSQFLSKLNSKTKIILFGFSQGGAAASRWYVESNFTNSELILWGSSLPPEFDYAKLKTKLTNPVKIVIGDEDEFISEERLNDELKRLQEKQIDFELKKYPGNHDIQPELLKKINLFD